MRRFVAVSVVAATVCGSGCSSDASGSETTTPPSVTTTPATSPPVSTSPATTAATTSTTVEPTSTTSTTTTTAAPPTTDPTTALAAAVKQARLDLEAAVLAAEMDPANESLRAALLNFVTPERFAALDAFIAGLASDGLLVRRNPAIPGGVTFVSEVVLPDGAASTEAFVDACRVNSNVVYQPLDDGGEVIIDDAVTTTLSRLRFELVEGSWILESSQRLGAWEGPNSCEDS